MVLALASAALAGFTLLALLAGFALLAMLLGLDVAGAVQSGGSLCREDRWQARDALTTFPIAAGGGLAFGKAAVDPSVVDRPCALVLVPGDQGVVGLEKDVASGRGGAHQVVVCRASSRGDQGDPPFTPLVEVLEAIRI